MKDFKYVFGSALLHIQENDFELKGSETDVAGIPFGI